MEALTIETLRMDGGTQPRARISEKIVAQYAAAMAAGAEFPPVAVYFDGTDHWLADGFHRVRAARKAGMARIAADVRQGTLRDAVLFSVSANTAHGVQRTAGDLRRAVLLLLADEEWSQWSNAEIARRCACSESYVRSLGKHARGASSHSAKMRTVTRKGKTYRQNVARIGKATTGTRAKADPPAKTPFRPVRGLSELPPPMVPLSLPRQNPHLAANTLIELFDAPWLTALVERIAGHLSAANTGDSK